MTYLNEIKQALERIKPLLSDKYHVNSIGLFGSIAREDFSPSTSDIDIIVSFSQPIGVEFIDMADLIEKELNRKVEVVSRNGVKSKYFSQIESEILYV